MIAIIVHIFWGEKYKKKFRGKVKRNIVNADKRRKLWFLTSNPAIDECLTVFVQRAKKDLPFMLPDPMILPVLKVNQ